MAEHSATNAAEYERVLETPLGSKLKFVYDVPQLMDQGKPPPVFKRSLAGVDFDIKSKRLAEVHGTPAKNASGDLPAILLTPEEDGMEPQSLAMTRSIGDFYMHKFGVTWRPEVISVDLEEVRASHMRVVAISV